MTTQEQTVVHADFLPLLPAIERYASYRFRRLNSADREEAVADAVAYAFAEFVRLKRRGKDPSSFPSVLARFAALAVKGGRRVGGTATTRDVLAPAARRRRGFAVHGLDDPTPDGSGWWRDMLCDKRTAVAEQAALNVDVPAWLATLPEQKRRITELLAYGHGTGATAGLAGVTAGRVAQVRRELSDSWERFHAA